LILWNVSYPYSSVATSDVSRRKWLIPGAEYSIFTGQPLDPRDRKLDKQLEEALVPG
jgi:M-phase phosphoprotein 9